MARRHVRSHAKGCFIELDTLDEDGETWETHYRWNYAVQENLKRQGFTFPEADVLLLLDLSTQLVNEHILLDADVKDFGELSREVCKHINTKGANLKEQAVNRSRIAKLLASKNKDLQTKVEDLVKDPILMPGAGESAMSINVLCSDAIVTKELVFVRLANPVLSFIDCVISAQYCLFCFGPTEDEQACIAEGCAFAAMMSDYNFELMIREAATHVQVLRGFVKQIEDLVVLPHVHMHNTVKSLFSAPGTPARAKRTGSGEASPTKQQQGWESPSKGGQPVARNNPDAEDVLADLLEVFIRDFDHAEEEQRAGHDLHDETHHHDDVENPYVFDDSTHTESFVQMMAVDTDGPDTGRKRTLHRWHNALQQDCISELFPQLNYGGAAGREAAAEPRFMERVVSNSGGLNRSRSSSRLKRNNSGSSFRFDRSSTGRQPEPEDTLEWGSPHLPRESAPLMARALVELEEAGAVFLDLEASDAREMYQGVGAQLRERLETMGIAKLVGELGMDKLLAFLEHGGSWPYGERAELDGGYSGMAGGGGLSPKSGASSRGGSRESSMGRSVHGSSRRGSLTKGVSGANLRDLLRSTAATEEKEMSALFLESDHGAGGTWHEESLEVLCVHSAVLPPGRRVVMLVRLKEAVESDLGPGCPNIRWLYVRLGSFHPSEARHNEGTARAVSLFFASDDVYDRCDNAVDPAEIVDAIRSFMKHACIVPRARPIGMVQGGWLAAQGMAADRLAQGQRLWESLKQMNRRDAKNETLLRKRVRKELRLDHQRKSKSWLTRVRATVQKYSLPLLVGVAVALGFANLAPETYEYVAGLDHHGDYFDLAGGSGFELLGHPLTIHFFVNDIFMVFFFGLAAKEVTEALLPGGALNPVSKALSPLLATLGGVVGPVAVYLLSTWLLFEAGSFDQMTCDDGGGGGGGSSGHHDDHHQDDHHRRFLAGGGDDHGGSGGDCDPVDLMTVLMGWGVPTATDISLAWMVAVLIFGLGHNAIGFLLLLAVVDDGIGLVIIAVFYPDPDNPVAPQWLPLIPAGMLVAWGLRKLEVDVWWPYVCLAGPVSWFGFLLSHVHPALALVPIVPFLPAKHFGDHGHGEFDEGTAHGSQATQPSGSPVKRTPVLGPQDEEEDGDDQWVGTGSMSELRLGGQAGHGSGGAASNGGFGAPGEPEADESGLQGPPSERNNPLMRESRQESERSIPSASERGHGGFTPPDGPLDEPAGAPPDAASMRNQQQLKLPALDTRHGSPSRPPSLLVRQDSAVSAEAERQHLHLHPALHQFEHDLKLFVDCGMFFFAFANAGVQLSEPGGLTISIILALVVGKTLGIAGFAIAGDYFFGIKLPDGVTYGDVVMVAFIASMGLTVALFVAGEAFTNPELVGQAKMGALLSGLVGPIALLIDRYFRKPGLTRAATAKRKAAEFDSHVMRCTEEIDENVVREGLLRILKKRHADHLARSAAEAVASPTRKVARSAASPEGTTV